MKKTGLKKLDLQRETIVPLQSGDLEGAAGGQQGNQGTQTCFWTATCPTTQGGTVISVRPTISTISNSAISWSANPQK